MRKTNTKLQLKTKTVRVLQPGELVGVYGGEPLTNSPQFCRVAQYGVSPGREEPA